MKTTDAGREPGVGIQPHGQGCPRGLVSAINVHILLFKHSCSSPKLYLSSWQPCLFHTMPLTLNALSLRTVYIVRTVCSSDSVIHTRRLLLKRNPATISRPVQSGSTATAAPECGVGTRGGIHRQYVSPITPPVSPITHHFTVLALSPLHTTRRNRPPCWCGGPHLRSLIRSLFFSIILYSSSGA